MPDYKLFFKMTLENVTNLNLKDDSNLYYFLKLKCNACQTESEKYVAVSPHEKEPLPTGRGEANLVYRCKECGRKSQMDVKNYNTKSYSESDKWIPVAEFTCRGIEPVSFDPMDRIVVCQSASSERMFEFELGTEWCDYDDDSGEPVSVLEFESKIE